MLRITRWTQAQGILLEAVITLSFNRVFSIFRQEAARPPMRNCPTFMHHHTACPVETGMTLKLCINKKTNASPKHHRNIIT